MRIAVVLLACLAATAAAGCGSGSHSTASGPVSRGTIHLSQDTQMTQSALGIKAGTSSADVRAQLGAPINVREMGGQSCWWYRADQPNSSVDGIAFCMTPTHRVARITWSVHL